MPSESELTAWWGKPGDVPLVDIGRDLPFRAGQADGTRVGVWVHAGIAERMVIDLTAAWQHDRPNILRADGYNNRPIRDGVAPSRHARGLALDLFLTPFGVTPPGGVWTPDDELPSSFYNELAVRGLTLGRDWAKTDRPHVQDDRPPSHTSTPSTPKEIQQMADRLTSPATIAVAGLPHRFGFNGASITHITATEWPYWVLAAPAKPDLTLGTYDDLYALNSLLLKVADWEADEIADANADLYTALVS